MLGQWVFYNTNTSRCTDAPILSVFEVLVFCQGNHNCWCILLSLPTHYTDIIMSAIMTPRLFAQPFVQALRVTGLCQGHLPVTGGCPSQRASNAAKVSIRWRHHVMLTDGQGQHPALLDMYGSTGGLAEYRAAMLASRGFTTLALAHMGYQDLPQSLDINFEYFLVTYHRTAYF